MSNKHDDPSKIGITSNLFARAFPSSSADLSRNPLALKLHESASMFQRAKGHGPDVVASLMSDMRPAPLLPPPQPHRMASVHPAPLPIPPPKPPGPAVIHLGITLRGLRKLMDKIRGICEAGGRFQVDFDNLTTTEMVYE